MAPPMKNAIASFDKNLPGSAVYVKCSKWHFNEYVSSYDFCLFFVRQYDRI